MRLKVIDSLEIVPKLLHGIDIDPDPVSLINSLKKRLLSY
jgi:hypothetical protein